MEKLCAPHPLPPSSTDLRLSNSSEVGGEVARLLWNIDGGGLHLLASSAILKKQLLFSYQWKVSYLPCPVSLTQSVTLLWTILFLSVLYIFLDINTKWIRYLVFNSDIFQWVMVNRPWISRKVVNGIFQDNLVLHRLTSYGHFCWRERWKALKKNIINKRIRLRIPCGCGCTFCFRFFKKLWIFKIQWKLPMTNLDS